jgi:hypothetical protein
MPTLIRSVGYEKVTATERVGAAAPVPNLHILMGTDFPQRNSGAVAPRSDIPQHRTILLLSIPRVALRVSTTNCDS